MSIARRVQDPLAELVKIEPKSIGVGQYQHDVSQSKLARNLDASSRLLATPSASTETTPRYLCSRASGLNASLAANIVGYRDLTMVPSVRAAS